MIADGVKKKALNFFAHKDRISLKQSHGWQLYFNSLPCCLRSDIRGVRNTPSTVILRLERIKSIVSLLREALGYGGFIDLIWITFLSGR